ncbi:hypothetical protein F480_10185 [Bibersteinia trehalosi Y31]|uniref:Uncharacterized protein n=1 Tax=Bibersteinia trehalosi Y31 TaxID=1261658 RepID=A0A179CYV2_BIBTR|nr:hypothetical protein F480_10185 [Bibersteinia trehalosi Y31]
MRNNPQKSWFFHVEKNENDEFYLRCKGVSNLKILFGVFLLIVILLVFQFPEVRKAVTLLVGVIK